MRLLAAELNRLLSRRFTVIALLLVIAAVGAFQLAVNSALRPPTAAEQAAGQAQLAEAREFWAANEKTCTDAGDPPDCRYPEPQADDYTVSDSFEDVATSSLQVSIYLVALTALMIAGSFIGAEYSSGSIANWLSFIPRRGRVFASKLVTVLGFSAVVSALATGLALAAALVLATAYGVPTGGLPDQLALLGRGMLAAVALATLGFCIALVGRHTAAAIGALLGYLFVWFVRNSALAETAWAQQLVPWTPEANLAAIIDNGYAYSVPVRTVGTDGVSFDYLERTVSLNHGLVFWGVLLAVVVVGTAIVFRRRDVS